MADSTSSRRHYKSVLKDMFLYGMFGTGSQVASVLLLPFLTRLLSVDEYGAVDLVSITSTFAVSFMTLSLPWALIRHFHENDGADAKRQMVSTLFWFIFLISIAASSILFLVTPHIITVMGGTGLSVRHFRMGWFNAALLAPLGLLTAALRTDRRIIELGVVNVTSLLAYIGLATSLVGVYRLGVTGILASMIVSSVLSLAISLFLTRRWLGLSFSWPVCREMLAYSLPFVPAIMTNWVNRRGTRLIITLYLTLGDVGIYAVGFTLASVISAVVTPFRDSWPPYVMSILKHRDFSDVSKRMLSLYTGGCVALGLLLLTCGKEICLFLLNPSYIDAFPLLLWLMGGIILHSSGEVTGVGVNEAKKTIINTFASWASVAVNIGLALVLIPITGINGAASAFFVAELVYTLILTVSTYRLHPEIRFDHSTLLLYLAFYLGAGNLIMWLALHTEWLVLRYAVGIGSAGLVVIHLNVLPTLISSARRRLFLEIQARSE